MTGQTPLDLIEPPLPGALAHVWHWFLELSAARGSTGFGPAPIGYRDMADWSRMTGAQPTPFEVGLLREIDLQYFALTFSDKPKQDAR